MISESAQSCGGWAETRDPDAAYREDFLRLLARLELEPAQAIALVEAGTGRPFNTCSPTQLLPLLQELLKLLDSHRTLLDARPSCHA